MGFIVDGYTEKLILQSICPNTKVARLDLNGKNVSVQAMAKKIASLVRLFGGRHYPIIVLVDKENRDIEAQQFRDEIVEALKCYELSHEDIRIGVADRMLENWLLADWECLECEGSRPETTDGINGSAALRKVIGNFGKTTDVVQLFTKASCSRMRNYSRSFDCFIALIEDLDCYFTQT